MAVKINHLKKIYNGKTIFEDVNLEFHDQGIYCLMGASGSGKTTLMHILLGLVHEDGGSIEYPAGTRWSAVFQEDRLCEGFSAVENIGMVTGKEMSKAEIIRMLKKILPPEAIAKPVKDLSGGMKRRVAICRAMLAKSDIVIMDEPFTGLDEATKQKVVAFILENLKGRMLILSTHYMSEVNMLQGEIVHFIK